MKKKKILCGILVATCICLGLGLRGKIQKTYATMSLFSPVQEEKVVITSFDCLPEETRVQIVPLGTKKEELQLPTTLTAKVQSENPVSGSAASVVSEESIQVEGITWDSVKESGEASVYDENKQEAYYFIANIPQQYELSPELELPRIEVIISGEQTEQTEQKVINMSEYSNGQMLEIKDNTVEYVLTGEQKDGAGVRIADSLGNVKLVLRDCIITNMHTQNVQPALHIGNHNQVNIGLEGKNQLKGGKGGAGLQVGGDSTVEINSSKETGELIASSEATAAGIGRGWDYPGIQEEELHSSTITVNSGIIRAIGAGAGAGIGNVGKEKDNIIINGGEITATSASNGKGSAIGGGVENGFGTITFNGGVVHTFSARAVSIGSNLKDGTVILNGSKIDGGEKKVTFGAKQIQVNQFSIAGMPGTEIEYGSMKPIITGEASGLSIEPAIKLLDEKGEEKQITQDLPCGNYFLKATFAMSDFIFSKDLEDATQGIEVTQDGKQLTQTKEITVIPKTLTESMLQKISDCVYTGKLCKPEVCLIDGEKVLKIGKDYDVIYQDNIEAGMAKAAIEGKGNYTGKITATFFIKKSAREMTGIVQLPIQNHLIEVQKEKQDGCFEAKIRAPYGIDLYGNVIVVPDERLLLEAVKMAKDGDEKVKKIDLVLSINADNPVKDLKVEIKKSLLAQLCKESTVKSMKIIENQDKMKFDRSMLEKMNKTLQKDILVSMEQQKDSKKVIKIQKEGSKSIKTTSLQKGIKQLLIAQYKK